MVDLGPELAEEVMITGDLHGHRDNFNAIRRVAALDEHPGRHLILQEVCHGGPTYPSNGGCMSHAMLEDVARLIVQVSRPGPFHPGQPRAGRADRLSHPEEQADAQPAVPLGVAARVRPGHGEGPRGVLPVPAELPAGGPPARRGVRLAQLPGQRRPAAASTRRIFSTPAGPGEYHERTGVFELVWGRDYRQENAEAFAELVGANGADQRPRAVCRRVQRASTHRRSSWIAAASKACYVILPTGEELDPGGDRPADPMAAVSLAA